MSVPSRVLPGRLAAEKMFPAGDERFAVTRLKLRSGLHVRAVECGPADGLPVVLFPGWACPAYVFRSVLLALCTEGYRGVVAELKGHGLSDKPVDPRAYGTESMVSHVVDILDALGFDHLVLGGHSMGAALAARAAPTLGDRIRALILLSPVGTHGLVRRNVVRFLPRRALRSIYPYAVRRWVVRFVLKMASGKGSVRTPRDIDEYWAASQFLEFAPAMRYLLHELDWGEKERVDFLKLRVPSLVAYGTCDPLVTKTRVLEEAKHAPKVRIVPIPNAGHVIPDEAPALVSRAILDFLANATVGSPFCADKQRSGAGASPRADSGPTAS